MLVNHLYTFRRIDVDVINYARKIQITKNSTSSYGTPDTVQVQERVCSAMVSHAE